MERPKISEGLLYSRHWVRCFLCIILFNLHFSSNRWCRYPEYADVETWHSVGVSYLAPSPTAVLQRSYLNPVLLKSKS